MSELTVAEVVGMLASGWKMVQVDHGGHDGYGFELTRGSYDVSTLFAQLHRDGWIESTGNGNVWRLTDAGHAAYMRSTDELGDGKLLLTQPPAAERAQDRG